MNDFNFKSPYTPSNRIRRTLWSLCWTLLAKPFPKSIANSWKIFILKCFGAKIAHNAYVYSSAKIFMPWNLIMEEHTCIASGVDCYNAARVIIKKMRQYHKELTYVQLHIIFLLLTMNKSKDLSLSKKMHGSQLRHSLGQESQLEKAL